MSQRIANLLRIVHRYFVQCLVVRWSIRELYADISNCTNVIEYVANVRFTWDSMHSPLLTWITHKPTSAGMPRPSAIARIRCSPIAVPGLAVPVILLLAVLLAATSVESR